MRWSTVQIGEHGWLIATGSNWITEYVRAHFQATEAEGGSGTPADLFVQVSDGYGRPFDGFLVETLCRNGWAQFKRNDYLVRYSPGQNQAEVRVRDDFALKHALMNLYSAFVVHREWGLLIHSSCIVEQGRAYLFAGQSGAGKSTVARLSLPRLVLSDEATVVKVAEGEVTVFNSPFRSGLEADWSVGTTRAWPLASIQLLRQSPEIRRVVITRSAALMQLLGKVFYWAYAPEETAKVMRLCQRLVNSVPVYDLFFQKNDGFWKEIG